MISKIENELKKIQEINRKIEHIIDSAPEGQLVCATNKGCYQYYIDKRYVKKEDIELAKAIAYRDYCLSMKKSTMTIQDLLEKIKEIYQADVLNEVYRNLKPARRHLIRPIVNPTEYIIKEFEELEYEGKGFSEDDITEYYTIKGERVRSKSEKIIADELYRYNIPYKYEMPLELHGAKNIVIYPDFTVLNKRTGKKWIIEHFGMMDNDLYAENVIYKLNTYEKNNILIGKDLLIFYESSNCPLNTRLIKKYIDNYLI